jgi:hypothetical protein
VKKAARKLRSGRRRRQSPGRGKVPDEVGSHRSRSMAHRSSLCLSTGFAAYADAQSARRGMQSIGNAGATERAEVRQAWVGSEESGM